MAPLATGGSGAHGTRPHAETTQHRQRRLGMWVVRRLHGGHGKKPLAIKVAAPKEVKDGGR